MKISRRTVGRRGGVVLSALGVLVLLVVLMAPLGADANSARRGGCLTVQEPKIGDVGHAHAFIHFKTIDECTFSANSFVEIRVQDNGNWGPWSDALHRETTKSGHHDREIRLGDNHLSRGRVYEVRTGAIYFGTDY